MRSRRTSTLRFRFGRFSLLIALSVTAVVFLGFSFNYFILKQYDRAFYRYTKLMDFYFSTESMNINLRNYLYSGGQKDILHYEEWKAKALDAIRALQNVSGEDLGFRYSLLGNMVDTYAELADRMLQGSFERNNIHDWYDRFNRLSELIQDTYSQYFMITTNEMKVERLQLTVRWKSQLLISASILIIAFLGALAFSVSAIRSITEPIYAMVDNINKIKKGDFAISRTISDCREVNFLIHAFSSMASDIKKYIEELKEKNEIETRLMKMENVNLKIGHDLAQARFSNLQQKMNPHFLFNTLSTLSRLAYIEGAEKSSELMIKTANVLRYSLERGDSISTMEEEAQCAENYFEIQRKRIGDRANFCLTMDPELQKTPIPAMLLQPLVENCVIHGLKDSMGEIFIRVEIYRKEDRAIVTVEDNGVGIPQDRITKLLGRQALDNDVKLSLGINNILQRLDICYSGNYKFTIESEDHCGTLVTIDLPLTLELEYDPLIDRRR